MSNLEKEDPYAITAWGDEESDLVDLTLPSGQRCQVKKLEMEDIIRLGLVNELDTFSGLLSSDEKGEDESQMDFIKRLSDGDNFSRLTKTVEKVVLETVQKPKIYPKPDQPKDRKKGRAYIDHVKFGDQMFIFNTVFDGMGAWGDFREGQDDGVGAVESKSEPEVQAV